VIGSGAAGAPVPVGADSVVDAADDVVSPRETRL
jgi:hypothetical protein